MATFLGNRLDHRFSRGQGKPSGLVVTGICHFIKGFASVSFTADAQPAEQSYSYPQATVMCNVDIASSFNSVVRKFTLFFYIYGLMQLIWTKYDVGHNSDHNLVSIVTRYVYIYIHVLTIVAQVVCVCALVNPAVWAIRKTQILISTHTHTTCATMVSTYIYVYVSCNNAHRIMVRFMTYFIFCSAELH